MTSIMQANLNSSSSINEDKEKLDLEIAKKRAYLNARDRKRREEIKQHFFKLKNFIPCLQNCKSVTRNKILKAAADYIMYLRRSIHTQLKAIDIVNEMNASVEEEIEKLAKCSVELNSLYDTDEESPFEDFITDVDVSDESSSDSQFLTSEISTGSLQYDSSNI